MKNILIKSAIILLIIISTAVSIGSSIAMMTGFIPVSPDYAILWIYILLSLLTFLFIQKFAPKVGLAGIFIPIVLTIAFIQYPKLASSSINFTIRQIPFFTACVLGLLSGYVFSKSRKLLIPGLFLLFPIGMLAGGYDMWIYTTEFGSPSGKVLASEAPAFTVIDKNGTPIDNDALRGKVVLMDFWYIGCRECWVKFPKLQETYDKFKNNEQVVVLAINRPMRNDKPGQLYSAIENKDYDFPVVEGLEQMMQDFGVTYYPTVMILDQNGTIVYKGGIEKAEEIILELI